jgi:hypothetical protein
MNTINKPTTAEQMMKLRAAVFVTAVCITGFLFLSASVSGGDRYQIDRHTINGSGTSSSEQYSLTGTICRSDAKAISGGQYGVSGGFWPSGPLCFVNFEQFSTFAEYWLQSGSGLPADLNGNEKVDIYDLQLFVDEWLCLCPYNWPLR